MRFLDYHKVKDAERHKAKELFGTEDAPSDLATKVRHSPHPGIIPHWPLLTASSPQIRGQKSKGPAAALANGPADTSKLARIKLTDAEKKKLQEMIKKASSLEEIIRFEKMLNEGRLPPGFHADSDAMEE